MGELVIESDYMNAFKISFHISDAGIEYVKETIHPKYVNLAPEIIERVFYPKHVLKGQIMTITHKQQVHNTSSLKAQKSGWERLTFEQLRVEAKSTGWKVIKQAADWEASFYRFVSMIHLGGSDIGPFTPDNANRIYDFLKPAIEEFSDEKNTQMQALINTMATIGSRILERGPATVQLGAPSPRPDAADPGPTNSNRNIMPRARGGSKTRRKKSRK